MRHTLNEWLENGEKYRSDWSGKLYYWEYLINGGVLNKWGGLTDWVKNNNWAPPPIIGPGRVTVIQLCVSYFASLHSNLVTPPDGK